MSVKSILRNSQKTVKGFLSKSAPKLEKIDVKREGFNYGKPPKKGFNPEMMEARLQKQLMI